MYCLNGAWCGHLVQEFKLRGEEEEAAFGGDLFGEVEVGGADKDLVVLVGYAVG